ncbi:MAG: RCKP-type rubredoxin-like domain-containing protein [Desulfobaccales bacterium]
MAVFTCEKCGATIDTRCKPKKCHICGEMACMCKQETAAPPKKGKK